MGIASSAGGLQAVSKVISGIPSDFAATILLVQHLYPRYRSNMAEILSRHTALKVSEAAEGDLPAAGHLYVAVPDKHLVVNSEHSISLSKAPAKRYLRPSADLLFESIAQHFSHHAIVVVLSGTGSDGSLGVQAIKKMGGVTIAQDEASSEFFGMPHSAIQTGNVDLVLPLEEIANALCTLVGKKG